jgi:hypothetical protein
VARVTGANGENVIVATGETQAEVWFRAAEQARSLGMLATEIIQCLSFASPR